MSAMEWTTVEAGDRAKLSVRLFKPAPGEAAAEGEDIAVVLVHPYTILGGVQGLLRGMAEGVARRGYHAITFDMRGAGRSTGRASLTGSTEVGDVVAVCRWVAENLNPRGVLLVGSSAGAPIAGSAVDKVDQVVGYVSIGYPFGLMASVLFGRHHNAILKSEKPKLFIMGTKDGFTSVKQLENKLKNATGRVDTHLIEGAGHFQMEGPAFDAQMVDLIVNFIKSLPK
uniref:Xaa-Pro dipeptidyl-peptidase-like domain-containing protein n=1 Tax=Leersia perrieri TaxID=77586 RepID=A0A0D9VK84_9ORYZ